MTDKRVQLLSSAPVWQAIIKMSLPVVAGMMVQVLYNLVDTFFIGLMNEPNQLAASNLAMPIFMIIMATAGIIGTGAASYISRCLGAQKPEEAQKTLVLSFGLSLALSLVIMFFGLFFLDSLIRVLGASDQTFQYAKDYTQVLLWGASISLTNFAVSQLLRSEGSVMISMQGMMIGTVANIILDPLFIFTFKMGVKGAAIATVLGNATALLFYISAYLRKKTVLVLNIKGFSFDKHILGEILAIGLPASLSQMLMSFALVFSNNIAASYSDLTLAAIGLSQKIMTIATFIFMGFAAGCQPIIGFNYGAKNFLRLKKVLKTGMLLTSSIGCFFLLLFSFFGNYFISIFSKNTEVIEFGTTILHAGMFSLPFVGSQMMSMVSIQAMGKAKEALVLSVSRQGLIFIPLLLLLNYLFAFNGFIFAQPITDMLTLILSLILLRITLKGKNT